MMVKLPSINDLKYFVKAVSNGQKNDQGIKTAIYLLEELPAARDCILEFFITTFDASVKNYLMNSNNSSYVDDPQITDIKEALENLVLNGPHAWAPLLSGWSLTVLGKILDSHGRNTMHSNIQSVNNFWMNCHPIKSLLSVATTCFAKLTPPETETAITVLLNTFVKHAPHFDWVVARLGSCFSLTVITRILKFGLESFASNPKNPQNSEIGILAELCSVNESSLVMALKQVILEHFEERKNPVTISYLIHLSRVSQTLLQPIVKVFLQLFEGDRISLKNFQQNLNEAGSPEMYKLLTSLAMRINDNGTKILLLLAKLGEVKFCYEVLEHILLELEYLILDDRSLSGEYPLLLDVLKEHSKPMLWKNCLSSNALEQQTAIRLLLLIAPRSPYSYQQTIVELMKVPELAQGSLVRVLGGVSGVCLEGLDPKVGIEMCLDQILLCQRNSYDDSVYENEEFSKEITILKNLLKLITLEKSNVSVHLKKVSSILSRHCIPTLTKAAEQSFKHMNNDQLVPFTKNLKSPESSVKKIKSETRNVKLYSALHEQLHLIVEILDQLDVKVNLLSTIDVLRITQLFVKYFFWNLAERNDQIRIQGTERVLSQLRRICSAKKAARTCALRELIEGALFMHKNLFGAPIDSVEMNNGDSLMKLNQNQDVICGTNRSVLHAGLIGSGLRLVEKPVEPPAGEIQKAFLDAIVACCFSENHSDLNKERSLLADGFSTVSLLLVEIVSPDVMYNGLPWPEEEFTKVTMERDLQIRRMFKNSPILWSILSLIASHRPALCISSVLLRALCASVLHQWRARSVEKSFSGTIRNPDLMFVTTKLLEVMGQGQLLPPPLNFLHLVIEHLDSAEVALILRDCVWNYMRENIPSPVLFEGTPSGVHWRNPETSRPAPIFTDPLRRIMLKRLPTVGALYHQMFVLPSQLK